MLTKTVFVPQGKKPACFAAAAAMATGDTLAAVEAFLEKEGSYSVRDVVRWLLYRGYCLLPGAYTKSRVLVEECPGVELKAVIDADLMEVLQGYAESLDMDLSCVVNGLLHKAMKDYGAKTRQGHRYMSSAGPTVSRFFERSTGIVEYVVSSQTPALVIVNGDADTDHALYWDGAFLWDPAKPEADNPVSQEDYMVFAWLPISGFSDDGNLEGWPPSIINKHTEGE